MLRELRYQLWALQEDGSLQAWDPRDWLGWAAGLAGEDAKGVKIPAVALLEDSSLQAWDLRDWLG